MTNNLAKSWHALPETWVLKPTRLLFVLGGCQRFWRSVILFEISSTPGTEVDSDTAFAGVRRLLPLLPELQKREKSMPSSPNENSAKSIFMESNRSVRFKFLTTPNSLHGQNLISKTRLGPV